MEGGMRVPCIARWGGQIPAGKTCDELCSTMDLLPTLAKLAGASVPEDRQIDGHDIWPLLSDPAEAKTPYRAFYYYHQDQLQAVRSGRWKLHLALAARQANLRGDTAKSEAKLYDLQTDLAESENVAARHPAVVKRLMALAEEARHDLGDVGKPGGNQRPCGRVKNPQPRVLDR